MELKIEREFQDLIRPLTEAEFNQLRDNILEAGEAYDPLAVWNGTLIDGHHRWKIIKEHPEIKYKVTQMDFADKWAAFEWVFRKHFGRRNLTEKETAYYMGKMYEARKKKQGGQVGNENAKNEVDKMSESFKNIREAKDGTAGIIGKEFGVDGKTVRRAEHFAKGLDRAAEVDPDFKREVLAGKVETPKTTVAAIRELESDEEVKQAIEVIRNPEKKKEAGVSTKEVRDRFAKIRDVARRMGQGHSANTFDDILTLLNAASDDFIWKIRRTIEGEKDALKKDDRWPDALEGYFDSIIHDIEELKGEITK